MEAIHRKDLKTLVAIVEANVAAHNFPSERVLKAARDACENAGNAAAADFIRRLMLQSGWSRSGDAFLATRARIFAAQGNWEELSQVLFVEGQRFPGKMLCGIIQYLSTSLAGTAFYVMDCQMAKLVDAVDDPKGFVWSSLRSLSLLGRALLSVYAAIDDRTKVAALIETESIIMHLAHMGHSEIPSRS